MSTPLKVYAGASALHHLHKQGLQASDINMVLGASAGPKWLVLHGIDRTLLTHFFDQRETPLHLLGTSAGAWRMACYAQTDALAAHDRLTESYIQQRYSEKPSGDEVLSSCRNMVSSMLGNHGANEIINHRWARMHLITTQCHGLSAAQSRPVQGAAFVLAGLGNLIHRKSLSLAFTRVVMHHPNSKPPLIHINDIRSRQYELNSHNIAEAILSTGCIPVITKGVKDIAGPGLYQDGGITDYGFDLPFLPEKGFVLYPHFVKQPAPGWLDKTLKWRRPSKQNYDKTIMLVPSDEFIASLPFSKIPDRNDFLKLNDNERIHYWKEVVSRSQLLGDALKCMDWQQAEPLPW